MTFRVGQKVACVNNGPSRFDGSPSGLKRQVYTVASAWHDEMWDCPCVLLDEVLPFNGYGFDATRFRPVVERKTDICVFTEILRKATKPARVPSVAMSQHQSGTENV